MSRGTNSTSLPEEIGDVGEPEAVEGDDQRGEDHQQEDERAEDVGRVALDAALLQEIVRSRAFGEHVEVDRPQAPDDREAHHARRRASPTTSTRSARASRGRNAPTCARNARTGSIRISTFSIGLLASPQPRRRPSAEQRPDALQRARAPRSGGSPSS